MAKLWTGRFAKETDHSLDVLNASLPFDQRLYRQDITGSMAHAKMLARQGIISAADGEAIVNGLQTILDDIEAGKLIMEGAEDIHPLWNRSSPGSVMRGNGCTPHVPATIRWRWTCGCMSRKKSRRSMRSCWV